MRGVSVRAMAMAICLVAADLISRRAGLGTIVQPPPDRAKFYLDRSFTRQMADLAPDTVDRLTALVAEKGLAHLVTVKNPLDINPAATDALFVEVVEALAADSGVDLGVIGMIPLTPSMSSLAMTAACGCLAASRVNRMRHWPAAHWTWCAPVTRNRGMRSCSRGMCRSTAIPPWLNASARRWVDWISTGRSSCRDLPGISSRMRSGAACALPRGKGHASAAAASKSCRNT